MGPLAERNRQRQELRREVKSGTIAGVSTVVIVSASVYVWKSASKIATAARGGLSWLADWLTGNANVQMWWSIVVHALLVWFVFLWVRRRLREVVQREAEPDGPPGVLTYRGERIPITDLDLSILKMVAKPSMSLDQTETVPLVDFGSILSSHQHAGRLHVEESVSKLVQLSFIRKFMGHTSRDVDGIYQLDAAGRQYLVRSNLV